MPTGFLFALIFVIVSHCLARPTAIGTKETFLNFLPNTVLTTVCNTGYLALTKNLIISLERLNLGRYLVVASTEPSALNLLLEMEEFSGKLLSIGNDSATELAEWYDHRAFKARGSVAKLAVLRYFLSRGKNVFYLDSDIAVLKDFREFFSPWDLRNYDLIIQNGSGVLHYPAKLDPCTGFMYLRASPVTLDFVDLDKHSGLFSQATGDQQYLLKNFLNTGSWNYKQLPQTKFPNGEYLYYIVKTKEELRSLSPYIVHMNFVVGGNKKLAKHKQYGTLLYDPN